jgi:hypothetical protein
MLARASNKRNIVRKLGFYSFQVFFNVFTDTFFQLVNQALETNTVKAPTCSVNPTVNFTLCLAKPYESSPRPLESIH